MRESGGVIVIASIAAAVVSGIYTAVMFCLGTWGPESYGEAAAYWTVPLVVTAAFALLARASASLSAGA